MSEQPDIAWLKQRWRLPDEAVPAVEALLNAESEGSTACRMDSRVSDWGDAVTRVVAGDSQTSVTTPLVCLEVGADQFLQSRALYLTERAIFQMLSKRAVDTKECPSMGTSLKALFPGAKPADPQVEACRNSLCRGLTLVTGGPGTGKTYTLARMIALLVSAGGVSSKKIQLAAPTGKAAERMSQAVKDSLQSLPNSIGEADEDFSSVAARSSTLHSLLGYDMVSGRCRFHSGNPLPCEVLIVDECSMIDVRLWRALLSALPAECRLILLGDPHQLESVGQGNILVELELLAQNNSALAQCYVRLIHSRRFENQPNIGKLAECLQQGDVVATERLLNEVKGSEAKEGLAWLGPLSGTLSLSQLPDVVKAAIAAIAQATTPDEALSILPTVGILTAQRRFSAGSLHTAAHLQSEINQLPGARNTPIIINRNDHESHLHNGEVGVIHSDAQGLQIAWFPPIHGEKPRHFSPAILPPFSPAWAITIHRSQGSEYDHVVVVLPHAESPLATRSLLYTAITRAKKSVFVIGDLSAVQRAVETPSARTTLLRLAFAQ